MTSLFFFLQGAPSAPTSVWPDSVASWVTFLVVVLGAMAWVARWGKDRAGWDRAATALEKLSTEVSSLVFEIRGVNGRGGINSRLDRIEEELDEIKERRHDADVLLEVFKAELQGRKERGDPTRRGSDRVIDKLLPET